MTAVTIECRGGTALCHCTTGLDTLRCAAWIWDKYRKTVHGLEFEFCLDWIG